METASKKELVARIHDVLIKKYGESAPHKTVLLDMVDQLMEEMVSVISHGDRIELRGFGVFSPVRRKERTARNPKTGLKVEVPARNAVVFKPGKEFKERLNKRKTASTT